MEDQNTITLTCYVCLLIIAIVMIVMFVATLLKKFWNMFREFEKQQEKKRHAETGDLILKTIKFENYEWE